MHWYIDVLKKYAVFNGRASRQEFWMFTLFNFIVSILVNIIGDALGIPVLGMIYLLAVLLPSLGVTIRRLHDTDRSDWWLLITPIPIIGLVFIIFACLDSTPGDNRFGPNPKGVAAASPSEETPVIS